MRAPAIPLASGFPLAMDIQRIIRGIMPHIITDRTHIMVMGMVADFPLATIVAVAAIITTITMGITDIMVIGSSIKS